MGESGGRAATGPPPLVAIHHPHGDRARTLAAAVAAAGFGTMLLPPFAGAASDWRDGCFDCLVLDPFGGTQPPRELILLARGIAARRPLLILSDRDSRADRMLALGAGADDAVGWAENPIEVVARIASLVRRSRLAAGQLGAGELRIDLIDRRVERAGRLIRLPLREFDLLANLARVPGRPVSRETLLKAVWRIDFDPGTNRVEVHMSRLRARIDRGFAWPMLHTVKGRGYALRTRPGELA
ncbi:response regulator transcription factor [Sphingopyxis panaciterrulae]|uniref:Two-component system OmpR family response regulator n=1 Tax=Sphingopyxis panaciterrulae TaxID=462372 RepID=A0A7W9B3V4_9SPHN|nr:response regulator transcription factor [Sphingopyxis panaciterrulae]MBB5705758.1 two-component system OmpR family response regulator [Sphingopyxis panaciterrulae]